VAKTAVFPYARRLAIKQDVYTILADEMGKLSKHLLDGAPNHERIFALNLLGREVAHLRTLAERARLSLGGRRG
jgi:hypothetical protein